MMMDKLLLISLIDICYWYYHSVIDSIIELWSMELIEHGAIGIILLGISH